MQADADVALRQRLRNDQRRHGGGPRASWRAHTPESDRKDWLRFATVRVAFFSGDFAECEAMTGTKPRLLPLAIFRTLALAMQGRKREASAAYRSMRRKFPKVDFEDYAARLPIAAPAARSVYDEAIRRLGTK